MDDFGAIFHEILPWMSVGVLGLVYVVMQYVKSKQTRRNYSSIGLIIGAVAGAGIGLTQMIRMGIILPLAIAIGYAVGTCVQEKE